MKMVLSAVSLVSFMVGSLLGIMHQYDIGTFILVGACYFAIREGQTK